MTDDQEFKREFKQSFLRKFSMANYFTMIWSLGVLLLTLVTIINNG